MTPCFTDSNTLFWDGIMIGRYKLGTIFSCHSKLHLVFSTLASYPSTAKNGTGVEFQTINEGMTVCDGIP